MGESKDKIKTTKKRKKVKDELQESKKLADEYLSQLKYLKADFANYKKRIEREKEELRKYAAEQVIIQILDVLDNIERAIEAGKKGTGSENLLEGVEMIYKQILKVLESEGVKCIKTEGEIFDPHIHECVLTEKTDEYEEDQIMMELNKGYSLNDKIIRHSKVKIAKNN